MRIDRPTDRPECPGHGDRGATLITFALSIVAICAVIALVLGGSLGYDAERNSQTSSDAAALAATSTLRNVQTSSPTSLSEFDVVYDTAETIAQSNGANEGEAVGCELIEPDGDTISDCGSATLADYISASGVRVGTRDTRDVPFGEVNNLTEISGATGAAATIQPLAEGQSPFMVCSAAAEHPEQILDASGEVNSAAIGEHFVLQGNAINEGGRDCGHPAESFRGWVQFDSTFPIPGDWKMEQGNKNGHIERQLIGVEACGGEGVDVNDFTGCVISVPLCTSGSGGASNYELYCVAMGSFRISHNDNGPSFCHPDPPKHICGEFLGAAVATGGQGAEEEAGVDEVVIIKLVE